MKKHTARMQTRFAVLRPYGWNTITRITVALRLTAALYIFWNPLWGMLASFFMDWFDSYLLIQRNGFSRNDYEMLDKQLDQVWSVVMLLAGLGTPYGMLLLVLFAFRLLGHAVYLAVKDTRIFLFFPNVFEFAFLWFVALVPLGSTKVAMYTVLVWLVVGKLIQEAILHWIWPAWLSDMKRKRRPYPSVFRALGWNRLGV